VDFPDNRLYDPDQVIHRVTYPDESGEPIPTLGWEAHRAGIDDVRYLEALDRAITAGQKRLAAGAPAAALAETMKEAQEARRRHFDSIGRRWFEYLLQPGQLDRARREMADAAVALEHAVKTVP
jgi:hypothetical protein